MNNEDYRAMYWELRKELRIHESHAHERALDYVRVHKDRQNVATKIIASTREFKAKLDELERETW